MFKLGLIKNLEYLDAYRIYELSNDNNKRDLFIHQNLFYYNNYYCVFQILVSRDKLLK